MDWKEECKLINKHGEIFRFNVFDYKLGNSRYLHFVYRKERTKQDVFESLIDSFIYTGGVPKDMESEVVREILRGSYDKVYEAGAVIAGGHSIYDDDKQTCLLKNLSK